MKYTIKIIVSVVILFLFSAFSSDERINTVEDLGIAFFDNAVKKNLEGLENIRVTEKEIKRIIELSDLTKEKKELLNKLFLTKFSEEELLSNISKGLDNFIRDVKQTKGKLKKVSLIKIIDKTRKLNGLPFTIGDVKIEYSSNGKKGLITIQAIKAETGWRILDNVFTSLEGDNDEEW